MAKPNSSSLSLRSLLLLDICKGRGLIQFTAANCVSVLGIILNVGGGPNEGYIGGKYWSNPGAFNNGFKGLCSVFVTAAFSFAGTELVGLAAAETANPRKALPTACKQVFWRITIFYIVCLTIVGLLIPYDDPRLLNSSSGNSAASPFVISIKNAGIEVLPSIMNVVILIAVLSVGNSSIFGSSRTLAALAEQGQAPNWLRYVDRKGRPLTAIGISSALGFLAFIADSSVQGTVLEWLLALSGLSSIFTWGSICLAHIRFRTAWKRDNRLLSDLPFQSQAGLTGSWIGFCFNCVVLVAQFWTGAWPVGYKQMGVAEQIKNFFLAYLAVPVILLFYFGHKVFTKTPWGMKIRDIDLDSGRRDLNTKELVMEEQAERASWPRWKKVYKIFC
jgi:yeast amino acid transporter